MAGKYDIVIEQGATFSREITWKDSAGNPVNLTGWTGRMQIRYGDQLLKSLTSGYITLGGANGKITITIPADETEDMGFVIGKYDLELVQGSFVKRLIQGNVTLSREQTK